ncbi:uncharacterized protein LOC112542274, partial [Python bivittatus]|uniref:Uncharacterized protein LOC112542274 n=1 Tax=Python bivittatus TaxID=176946 RepID=A0A9F5N5Y6_PYTBI
MKKKGKQNSGKSSALGNQPGTSKDALEKMYQTPLSKESAKVSLGSQSKMASYSKEMFSTWRDIRWYQIPLSSLRRPKARLFSFTFQSSLQKYQQLRKIKQLKVGRPFSVLPLPNLSLSFTDPAPFQDTLQRDNHGSSRAGGSKGNKRLSAHRNESQAFLRRMQKKLQRRQPSANLLHPKCNSSAGSSGQPWETGLCRSSRKKSKQGDCAPLAETLEGGDSSSLWSNPNSPLEEEKEDEMFPPDWTPPRTAFLYNEEPPPLSPASGSIPEFQSSGEMPDIIEEPGGSSRMELRVKALSPVGSPVFVLKNSGAMQLKEFGKRHVDNPECSTFDVCQAADEELEELVLEDQREVSNQGVLEQEECSLLQSPVFSSGSPSTECFKSSILVSLDGFSGGPARLACELDVEGDSGTEGSSSSLPVHLLLPRSGISSRSSISASSDELSGDPGGLTQGSVMEEDMDDSSLVPVRDLLQMDDSSSSSVELSPCPLPGPESYLSSLDKLLEEKREQIREDRELDGSLGTKLLSSSWLSAGDAGEENEAPLSDAQREQIREDRELDGSLGTKLLSSSWLSAGDAGEENEAPLSDAQRPGGRVLVGLGGGVKNSAKGQRQERKEFGALVLKSDEPLGTERVWFLWKTQLVSFRATRLPDVSPEVWMCALHPSVPPSRSRAFWTHTGAERCGGDAPLTSGGAGGCLGPDWGGCTLSPSLTPRLVLEQFSISPAIIPTVHPGENIFRPSSYRRTALVLDTAGLTPQNPLESCLFSSAHQMAILHSGCLGSIYHGTVKCPRPVLHWLFQ